MKKLLDDPICINCMDDILNLIGYHPCQKIQYTCLVCGDTVIKTISAVRKMIKQTDGLYCLTCLRREKGKIKYGSDEKYDEHLKNVHKTIVDTLVSEVGSIEEVYRRRNEKYEQTCLERYGVKNTSMRDEFKHNMSINNPSKREDVKNKIKQSYTKEKRVEAAKKTVNKLKEENRYQDIVKKCKKTKEERYGDSGYVNHEKAKATFIEKYGVTCGFKTENYKNAIIQKYGSFEAFYKFINVIVL